MSSPSVKTGCPTSFMMRSMIAEPEPVMQPWMDIVHDGMIRSGASGHRSTGTIAGADCCRCRSGVQNRICCRSQRRLMSGRMQGSITILAKISTRAWRKEYRRPFSVGLRSQSWRSSGDWSNEARAKAGPDQTAIQAQAENELEGMARGYFAKA